MKRVEAVVRHRVATLNALRNRRTDDRLKSRLGVAGQKEMRTEYNCRPNPASK